MGSKQELFEKTLSTMNQEGDFVAAMLSMKDGLPLASSPSQYEDTMAAAMVTLLDETANKLNRELRLPQIDEISIVGDDGTRLVCRYFNVDGHTIMLTVVTRPDQSYRRLTKQTIREIKRIWIS
ncbi:MAG: hypothetical protein A2Y65_03640 [Deltaproteobacteria bacterium RBG_13_52_11]|nr:MAG: hypothetical protein A2Y65_03640 [Deltaproteobacteria bacterium RBG_13_52_11]